MPSVFRTPTEWGDPRTWDDYRPRREEDDEPIELLLPRKKAVKQPKPVVYVPPPPVVRLTGQRFPSQTTLK